MTKLVQRLQNTRDRVYGLSDKFGIVGHCDAVFVHRIFKQRFAVNPRPKLVEPTSRLLYKLAQTLEVNKDDKMLVGVSRAGFENYQRIQALPDGAVVELAGYRQQVLAEPVEAGYLLQTERPVDISIELQYPEPEWGLNTYLRIVETTVNRVMYRERYTAATRKVIGGVTLPVGAYQISTCYHRVLPLVTDPVRAATITVDGTTLERACRVGTEGGLLSIVDNSYVPLAVSWGTNDAFDFVYNGAICYLGGKPYSILWIDTNRQHDLEMLVRPERAR